MNCAIKNLNVDVTLSKRKLEYYLVILLHLEERERKEGGEGVGRVGISKEKCIASVI